MKKAISAFIILTLLFSCKKESEDERIIELGPNNLEYYYKGNDVEVLSSNVDRKNLSIPSNESNYVYFLGEKDGKLWVGIYEYESGKEFIVHQYDFDFKNQISFNNGYGDYSDLEFKEIEQNFILIENESVYMLTNLLYGHSSTRVSYLSIFNNSELTKVITNSGNRDYQKWNYSGVNGIKEWFNSSIILEKENFDCENGFGNACQTLEAINTQGDLKWETKENISLGNFEQLEAINMTEYVVVENYSLNRLSRCSVMNPETPSWTIEFEDIFPSVDLTTAQGEIKLVEKKNTSWKYKFEYVLYNGETESLQVDINLEDGSTL